MLEFFLAKGLLTQISFPTRMRRQGFRVLVITAHLAVALKAGSAGRVVENVDNYVFGHPQNQQGPERRRHLVFASASARQQRHSAPASRAGFGWLG